MSVAAVVVAGGHGVRFGALKQFLPLGDETVASRSVRLARSVADVVILVVPASYEGSGEGADVVVTGGASRAASVRAGLDNVADATIVVVHDAARPLASADLFTAVVTAVTNGAEAAIPGLAVTDTVKRVATEQGQLIATETLNRDELVTVQTPQAFRVDTLRAAHLSATEATDDAALVEAIGGRVVVVPGELTNTKITMPQDLDLVMRTLS